MSWFARVRRQFERRAKEFAGKPIVYVEIGVHRGDSAAWIARNILTHPKSKGFGIDPYTDHPDSQQWKAEAQDHLAATGVNWTWLPLPSQQALSRWEYGPIDLLYIDGKHQACNVLVDFCLAWPWLRVGSGVIFDDYAIGLRKPFPHVPEAVRAIEDCFCTLLEPWGEPHIERQAYFKVRAKDVSRRWYHDCHMPEKRK